MEAHVALRYLHGDDVHRGAVVPRGLVKQHVKLPAVALGEMPRRVVAWYLLPEVAAVNHRDRSHLHAAVVERNERGEHPL
jgi:hypothetical protein